MSEQDFRVRAFAPPSADSRIFGLRAFGEETRIETDQGPLPAKLLTRQHRIRTLNGPPLEIGSVERLELKRSFLQRYPDLKPVLIRGGQFRPGVPCRGVIVSPRQMLWIEPSGEHRGRFGSAQMLAKDP